MTSLFARAAVRLQVQIQSHAGLVRNPLQSQSPHYTHGSLCRQKSDLHNMSNSVRVRNIPDLIKESPCSEKRFSLINHRFIHTR